jgi:hypothetical protein
VPDVTADGVPRGDAGQADGGPVEDGDPAGVVGRQAGRQRRPARC